MDYFSLSRAIGRSRIEKKGIFRRCPSAPQVFVIGKLNYFVREQVGCHLGTMPREVAFSRKNGCGRINSGSDLRFSVAFVSTDCTVIERDQRGQGQTFLGCLSVQPAPRVTPSLQMLERAYSRRVWSWAYSQLDRSGQGLSPESGRRKLLPGQSRSVQLQSPKGPPSSHSPISRLGNTCANRAHSPKTHQPGRLACVRG